ncbi:DUF397 domain-containing protein [Embleya hyalina]|uniref:DUF397 domain-containing protein n=1 Tax=Embleya hyalina TaxID=516124 RepID=UPI000F840CEB|nr:DUF397 domain-containing protein [Embleya hyalina]
MTLRHTRPEARPAWRKSSYSHNDGDCVETAPVRASVAIRDSKDLSVGTLAVPHDAWTYMVDALKG